MTINISVLLEEFHISDEEIEEQEAARHEAMHANKLERQRELWWENASQRLHSNARRCSPDQVQYLTIPCTCLYLFFCFYQKQDHYAECTACLRWRKLENKWEKEIVDQDERWTCGRCSEPCEWKNTENRSETRLTATDEENRKKTVQRLCFNDC